MDKKLVVKNLKISFKTNNGPVQAVRNISFDLYKGETLAIVGESGSGKSVTSRAILGILAPNKIVESGEIIYDGKDLLKINEDDFHRIRGSKISMIFQDPMSSLNPIMRVGKQLTEAMLLKGSSAQREARRNFRNKNRLLQEYSTSYLSSKETGELFERTALKTAVIEREFSLAHEKLVNVKYDLSHAVNELRGNNYLQKEIMGITTLVTKTIRNVKCSNLFPGYVSLKEKSNQLAELKNDFASKEFFQQASELLRTLIEVLDSNPLSFFLIAYSANLKEVKSSTYEELLAIQDANSVKVKEFMKQYHVYCADSLANANSRVISNKESALTLLKRYKEVFLKETLELKEVKEAKKILTKSVSVCLNQLALIKDSFAYIFASGISAEISRYFYGLRTNDKKLGKYNASSAKHERLKARGKPTGKVAYPILVDLGQCKINIITSIDRLIEAFEADISKKKNDVSVKSVELADYLIDQITASVRKVTKTMAKQKALELMKEVGIPEPRKRYKQYPFQFSGGMRQRIVIAIALAANPDILICDEPTTALDVTIQAQILELINNLKRERQLSIIFITHDLGVVANMADRIGVMYAGKIVEMGTVDDIFYGARHPYTWALLSSMPDLNTKERLEPIPGTPPNMIFPPIGDAFAVRNKYALKIDFEQEPPFFQVSNTHYAATWLLHEDAPKVSPPKIVTERIKTMLALRRDNDGQEK